ncbi:MAG: hypothetical protein ACJ8G3_17915 [Burkholderiaceae bacterium]
MRESQEESGEAGAGEPDANTDGELSDDVLAEIAGGGSDAAVRMQAGKNETSTDIQPGPVNEVLGKVRSINYA